MTKKAKHFLILIWSFLGVIQVLHASQDCRNFFVQLSLNSSTSKKLSSRLSNEIRAAYSTYLKEVDPAEQSSVISLIAEAEEKFPRSRVQEELKSAITQCSIETK